MMRGLRKCLYFKAVELLSRIAPHDVRATHMEVMERGMKAYKEARTRKTEDLPFVREKRREETATRIVTHLEDLGDQYDLEYSPSIRLLAHDLAKIIN